MLANTYTVSFYIVIMGIDSFAGPRVGRRERREATERQGAENHEAAEKLATELFDLIESHEDGIGQRLDRYSPVVETKSGTKVKFHESISHNQVWGYRVILVDPKEEHFYAVFGGRGRILYAPDNDWLGLTPKSNSYDQEILSLLRQAKELAEAQSNKIN